MWLGRLDIYCLKSRDRPFDFQFPNKKACKDRSYVSFMFFSAFCPSSERLISFYYFHCRSPREYQRAKAGIVGLSEVNRLGVMVGVPQVAMVAS